MDFAGIDNIPSYFYVEPEPGAVAGGDNRLGLVRGDTARANDPRAGAPARDPENAGLEGISYSPGLFRTLFFFHDGDIGWPRLDQPRTSRCRREGLNNQQHLI